jgi:2,3-bisphosphoglycerate-independent phosphoglycerate mutase
MRMHVSIIHKDVPVPFYAGQMTRDDVPVPFYAGKMTRDDIDEFMSLFKIKGHADGAMQAI